METSKLVFVGGPFGIAYRLKVRPLFVIGFCALLCLKNGIYLRILLIVSLTLISPHPRFFLFSRKYFVIFCRVINGLKIVCSIFFGNAIFKQLNESKNKTFYNL